MLTVPLARRPASIPFPGQDRLEGSARGATPLPWGSGRPLSAAWGAGFSAYGGAPSTDPAILPMVEAMDPARLKEPLGYRVQVRQDAEAVKDFRVEF
jgi:hypothetical protein